MRARNFDYVMSQIDPEQSTNISREKVGEFAAYFPSGKLISTALIGSQVNTFNDVWQGTFSFEYEFESGWAIASIILKRVGTQTTVLGFHLNRTEASQKELNRFRLAGKSFFHYLILAFAFIVPIFVLISLIFCIKTPIPKRKWLWVIFVLGGIGSITMNWSTGAFVLKLLHYQLLGAGVVSAGEYAPWIVSVGFPLGASIFWFKRKSFIEQDRINKSKIQSDSNLKSSD